MYIEREKVIDAIDGTPWYHISESGNLRSGANSQLHTALYKSEDIYEVLESIPAANVAPVGRGEWVPQDDYYCCSACGQSISDECKRWFHYCPTCGAKMDESVRG